MGGELMNGFQHHPGTPDANDGLLRDLWFRDMCTDPAMAQLHDRLLVNEQFRQWCRSAEDLPHIRERNLVF
jgi:hypothetical protein